MSEDSDAEDAGAASDVEGCGAPADGEDTANGKGEDVSNDEDDHASDGGTNDHLENGDETVPHVELNLYELSVRVSGQSDDELGDVEDSATRLMEFLISQAKQLEDQPDTRGLG